MLCVQNTLRSAAFSRRWGYLLCTTSSTLSEEDEKKLKSRFYGGIIEHYDSIKAVKKNPDGG